VIRAALDFRNQLLLTDLARLPFLVCGLERLTWKALLRVIQKFEIAIGQRFISFLFPRGAYFGLVQANGPSNNVAPHAALALELPLGFSASIEYWAFWRESLADGVYSVPGTLLRPGNAGEGGFLGSQVEGFLTWQADRHLSLNATLAYFATGSFFDASVPGRDITYGAGWATYKF